MTLIRKLSTQCVDNRDGFKRMTQQLRAVFTEEKLKT